MNSRFEERLKAIPEIPKKFGEDGGHFYRYYDTLAEEIDVDMVKSLKAQLDGILIFAGLFAGVNSAFLALTLPEMSADPAEDTNALLLHFVTGGNGSIRSAEDLPSASFSPASGILPVNILFSLSLTLALLASFLAVLGQQWLVYYSQRSGGGAEAQRWEQLRRYLGAKRWRLEAILDDILPSLLQLGLIIFCISFVLYLGTLSGPICYTVAVPMGLAFACIILMAVCAACDHWCPFKSPLSHLFQLIPSPIAQLTWRAALIFLYWTLAGFSGCKLFITNITRLLGQIARPAIRPYVSRTLTILRSAMQFINKITQVPIHQSLGDEDTSRKPKRNIVLWLTENIPRPAEPVERLESMAAKRVICTSEDTNSLVYAAINLQAITSPEEAGWLLSDDEFYFRLSEPWRPPLSNLFDIQSSDPRAVQMVAFSSSLLHLILSSPSIRFIPPPDQRSLAPSNSSGEDANVTEPPPDLEYLAMCLYCLADLRVESLCPTCTHCITLSLFARLLNRVLFMSIRYGLDSWFEEFGASQMHFTDETPMIAGLLACAVKAYGKLDGKEDQATRLRLAWYVFDTLYDIYRKRDVLGVVDFALEEFPPVDSPSRPADDVCLMLLERACALLRTAPLGSEQPWLIAKNALALFQYIIHRETRNHFSKHGEKHLVARCIDVVVQSFAQQKQSSLFPRFTDLVTDISKVLVACLSSAEQISVDEASTVDVSLFLNFLRIRDLLPSPAFYALLEGITENQRQSEYESAYDELVICFARLESAVLAVQRAARPVMADPADPQPIQVVDGEDGIGENSADGKNQPDWKPPATSPYDDGDVDGSGESMNQVL